MPWFSQLLNAWEFSVIVFVVWPHIFRMDMILFLSLFIWWQIGKKVERSNSPLNFPLPRKNGILGMKGRILRDFFAIKKGRERNSREDEFSSSLAVSHKLITNSVKETNNKVSIRTEETFQAECKESFCVATACCLFYDYFDLRCFYGFIWWLVWPTLVNLSRK